MDNAGDNNTALKEISRWLKATHNIIWDGEEYRLRCFGYVVSLIADAFISNKPLKAACILRAPKGTLKEKKPIWKRLMDAILKLYKIIFFAMRISVRAKEWMEYTTEVSDDFLHPIKDNDTRWFSIYLMLIRALTFKNTITVFTAQNLTSAKDEKNLSEFIMTKEDWLYCSEVIAFIKPLYLLVKRLEGKQECGSKGFIADVLPAFDFMEDYLAEQLDAFEAETIMEGGVLNKATSMIEGAVYTRSMGHTNTLNAQAKLLKYKIKNTSAVLFAACVLVPWRKWGFFEAYMTLNELAKAKKLI
jgi:hypothetical protein